MGSLPRMLIFCAISLCSCARGNEPYPIVDRSVQIERDDGRRAILEAELASEQTELRRAKDAVVKAPTEIARKEVHRHEENVKALLRELDRLTAPIRVTARTSSDDAAVAKQAASKSRRRSVLGCLPAHRATYRFSTTCKGIAMKTARTLQLVLLGAVLACSLFPELASAAPPFVNSGTTLKADLIQTVTPFAGIAVLIVGVLCLMGRVNWGWFVGGLVGIALMFGSDQIVAWFRTLMGV